LEEGGEERKREIEDVRKMSNIERTGQKTRRDHQWKAREESEKKNLESKSQKDATGGRRVRRRG